MKVATPPTVLECVVCEAPLNHPLSRTDGLYFTVTIFATVGFGDIAPRSELARIVTTTQMLFGLRSG